RSFSCVPSPPWCRSELSRPPYTAWATSNQSEPDGWRPITSALTPIMGRISVQNGAAARRVPTPRRCPVDGNGHLSAARIRARLSHPVIDADGHWLEYGPVVSDELRRVGGDRAAEGFLSIGGQVRESLSLSVAERRRRRISQEAFWSSPARNTRDRATGMLPRLLYERLDELGIDFAVLYPTVGLRVPRIADELHLQPYRPLRGRRPRCLQGAVPRRGDPALPSPPIRLPRGRRGLGVHAVHGPHRPLGQAEPEGAGAHRSPVARSRAAHGAGAEVRQRGARGRASPAGRLARPRCGHRHRRPRRPRRLRRVPDRAQRGSARSLRGELLFRLR